MHSGVTGLINMAYNESNSTVIILDSSFAASSSLTAASQAARS